MRLLVVSWGWPTHLFPMVPLAWAARAAGHEVLVAAPPGLTGTVTSAGLPPTPVGHDVDAVALVRKFAPTGSDTSVEALRRKGKRALGMYVEIAEAMIDDLIEVGRSWRPDVVLYEPTTYAGPLAAAVLGVPAVRHLWAADFTYRARPLEPEVFGPLHRRYGLDEVDNLGQLTVDPCPAGMQIDAEYPRQRCRYVPYNGPGTLPDDLVDTRRRRRACVTWGLTNTQLVNAEPKTAAIVDMLAHRGVETLLAVSDASAVDTDGLPDTVRVLNGVPLHLVMPSCSLIVHQGGPGTLLTAAAAGVPQLLLPDLPDRQLNAARLSAVGGGVHLGQDDGPDEIAAQLDRLLDDPGYLARADGLRRENDAMPDLDETVEAVRELAV